MPPSVDDLVAALGVAIPQAMRRLNIPGVAVGVCDPGGTLWSAGYGTTARGGGSPITPATRFSVQSTSKLVTATTMMLAVQQSMVDLDEPITTYLPDFTVNSTFDDDPGALITLRHLLSHTAGFTHEAPLGSNYHVGNGDFDAHCRSIFRTWLRFPVGHHHEYSNLGIDLAGYVLQRLTGEPFAEYPRRELFEPLGLTRSTFDPAVIEADTDRAIGHWRLYQDAGLPLPVDVPMVAAGGLYTSVADALGFVGLHLRAGAPLLAAGLIAEQSRPQFAAPGQQLGYGLGVYVDEWAPVVRVHHHGGSGFGFQAQLCWVPELSIGSVILTNSFDHSLQNEIAHQFVSHVAHGTRLTPPRHAGRAEPTRPDGVATEESHDLDSLVGEYVGRLGDRVEVAVDGNRLLVRGSETYPAHLTGPRDIEVESPTRERYRFTQGPDGAVAYLHDLRDGRVRYRNNAAGTPSCTLDPDCAGTYVALSWGVPTARYRIAQEGDAPVIQKLSDGGESNAPDIALRLSPIGPGLYLSSMGEVLDLTSTTPTYANIALTRAAAPPTQDPT